MNKPPPVEPRAVTVIDITDPSAANATAGVELLDCDALQLQSTPFRVRRVIVQLETARVMLHSASVRIRSRTSVRNGSLGYVIFGPQTSGAANGLPVRPGLMLAAPPDAETSFVTDPGWESITLLLPPDDLRAHLAARGRESEHRMPQGVEPLRVDVDRVRELYDWGRRLVDMACQAPDLFDSQLRERRAAQGEMLEMLLATLRVAGDFESSRTDRTRQAQSQIVKRIEQYVLAHPDERLYVTDLCKVAGISERSLEYAFKEHAGLTPIHYLTRLRLHRVRQALHAGTPDSTTVSVEALEWGFWHFGEFSRIYKECFGELPSDTLKRRS